MAYLAERLQYEFNFSIRRWLVSAWMLISACQHVIGRCSRGHCIKMPNLFSFSFIKAVDFSYWAPKVPVLMKVPGMLKKVLPLHTLCTGMQNFLKQVKSLPTAYGWKHQNIITTNFKLLPALTQLLLYAYKNFNKNTMYCGFFFMLKNHVEWLFNFLYRNQSIEPGTLFNSYTCSMIYVHHNTNQLFMSMNKSIDKI